MKAQKRIADAWSLSIAESEDVCAKLDLNGWLGGESQDCIDYAGIINDDVNPHNGGYFAATSENNGQICLVTNGDSTWCEWSEDVATALGVEWGEFEESMRQFKI